ncbi:MAG: zf-TFIIB domain-containing protein [Spirochaetales bacterium]|nr:zf-TFIIB domain-containing protein [Spirochaetales bacterium]
MYIKKEKVFCPKCKAIMEKINYMNVEIDRCTKCKGIWLDVFEKSELKAKKGSKEVDSGDKETGKKYDKMRNVNCPKCLTPMISKSDRDQKQITYETCPSCKGVFYDAGEFTDFKEETILDFIKKKIVKK